MTTKRNDEQIRQTTTTQDSIALELEVLEDRTAPSAFGRGGGRGGMTKIDPEP